MSAFNPVRLISDLGFATRSKLTELGHGARLLLRLLALSGPALGPARLRARSCIRQ